MIFGRRPTDPGKRIPSRVGLGRIFPTGAGVFAADDMPESLTPELRPERIKVYDDEIDPAWRDDETASGDDSPADSSPPA